jgi:hypothetical protein
VTAFTCRTCSAKADGMDSGRWRKYYDSLGEAIGEELICPNGHVMGKSLYPILSEGDDE